MSQFTTKQHAILQMLCRDASNEEIAKRLKVAPDTIKTHTVIIRKKLAAPRRAAVITSYAPVLARISDDDYLEASGGLPKSWDSEYRQDDPVNDLVTSRSN
jgi:DNA-binding CsgD family transcriptional regulator